MTSKPTKTLAIATLSALLLASPALSESGWGPQPRFVAPGDGRDLGMDPTALGDLALGLITSPTSYPVFFPLWGPQCRVAMQPVLNAQGVVVAHRAVQDCQ